MQRVVLLSAVLALVGAFGCSSKGGGDDDSVAGAAAGVAGASGVGAGAAGVAAGAAGVAAGAAGVGAGSGAGTSAGAAGVTAGTTAGTTAGAAGVTAGAAGVTAGTGGGTGGAGGGFSTTCGMPMQNAMVGNACPGTPPPGIKLTMIVDGLIAPTYVTQAPGDPSRLYVTEQRGTLRVIRDGTLAPDPVIDLRSAAMGAVSAAEIVPNSYAESGLLGMVFDPNFESSKRVWLSYTSPGPRFIVAVFKMDNPDTLEMSTYKELVTFPQYPFSVGEATNHVGSMLAFGPDGCLYISRGDGGGENDRQMSGQDTSDDLCSVLRVDPDNPMTPPAGNHDGLVWSYGFRNPWRFSFDRATGDMYIGDVGQDVGTGFEEIEIEPRGVAGRNYGWSMMQGKSSCSGNCDGMTGPAVAYGITDILNSVIGGYVYRGSKIPGLVGRYVWADWTERKIKTLVYQGEPGGVPTVCDEHDTGVTVDLKVRSFGEDLAGEIYVVAGGEPTAGLLGSASVSEAGKLYRIDPQ